MSHSIILIIRVTNDHSSVFVPNSSVLEVMFGMLSNNGILYRIWKNGSVLFGILLVKILKSHLKFWSSTETIW